MMFLFKSKVKRIALLLLILSTVSLVIHLSVTKFSAGDVFRNAAPIVDHFTLPDSQGGIPQIHVSAVGKKKLWGPVKELDSLHPYANPRTTYPVPYQKNNGYIYAKVSGGFEKIRSSICDLVTISRLLNATLLIPEIQESLRSKGISYKFKSFSYLYDEEQFIASLKNDVLIVKSLPEDLKASRKRKEFPTFKPKSSASPNFYIKEILPKLKKSKVIGLVLTDGGCLQSVLPPSMSEFQRLRCRVAFHALQFRQEIQVLGHRIVDRLRGQGQHFLAYHPGLVRESLAHQGCAELFQDVHTELIQYRREQMIKQGIIHDDLSVDSYLLRENGSCPLMPEEVGLLLRAMGYPPKTIIYLAGSETFGGQRLLIPLRAMFANLVDRTYLFSNKEFSYLLGPEAPLPTDLFQTPPALIEKQLKEEWNKAGPRPRPLPPPPSRPIYQHEKEGWYGWITETDTEPNPSLRDLRQQAHRLLWDALDYIVSVEADAYFPGYNNDGTGWPDFSSLVMGQRLYENANSRTYRPDRKVMAELFNMTRENMYYPKHNWTLRIREHLNKSLGKDGLIRESILSKPSLFLSHPLPECSCRIPSAEVQDELKSMDGRFLYGGEDECPKWMQDDRKAAHAESEGGEEGNTDDSEPDDEHGIAEKQESVDSGGNSMFSMEQDEEWDPND